MLSTPLSRVGSSRASRTVLRDRVSVSQLEFAGGEEATEDEMVRWHHQLNGHEFQQTLGDSEGQGSLACCNPWGCKESDTTLQLNRTID